MVSGWRVESRLVVSHDSRVVSGSGLRRGAWRDMGDGTEGRRQDGGDRGGVEVSVDGVMSHHSKIFVGS